MDFDVDTAQIDAWAARLKGADAVVRDELVGAMHRSVLTLEAKAKANAPVKTGTLRRSITGVVQPGGGAVRGVVGTNVPYARYVHDGRGPVVAHGKALRFEIGGQVLFRKRVGPAKGKPFLRDAFAASTAAILREFAQVIPRAARRLGF